jgi:translocation and assembly module TamB
VRNYRGRIDLDLNDASFVSVPVFRQLDKFLGASRGGLFEDGDLSGRIANRQLYVDVLTLEGRLVQIHASGTVGFDGQLNLEALVNTNEIIAQSGEALLAMIPGLRTVIRRREEAKLQFAGFLSNRLLKLRVSGTLKNPSVSADPTIGVADSAVSFFAGVLKLPLGLVR